MNALLMINIIQMFFPALVGLGFLLFPVNDQRSKARNLNIYCFIYFLLSAFSVSTLVMEKEFLPGALIILGGESFYPQKEIAKFILFSSLGYFFQIKKIERQQRDFSMNIFFQGVFFTLLNISMYVEGAFSTYCILELMIFSVIILDMINNDFWRRSNIILQGLGTTFILTSLMVVSFLMKEQAVNGQLGMLGKLFGVIDIRAILSLSLVMGILLKSTMIEYGGRGPENIKKMAIYLSVIKLYIPIRFLFEKNIFQIIDSTPIIIWGILIFCLIHCLKITAKNLDFGIIHVTELFGGLVLLGVAVLGGEGFDLLIKYSFYLTLLLLFYVNIEISEKNNFFGLIILMFSAVTMISTFYLFPKGGALEIERSLLIAGVVILYFMVKYIWNTAIKISRKIDLNFYNVDAYFVQNVIIIAIILILTEIDIETLVGGNIWLN